jgi:hypothetical protein
MEYLDAGAASTPVIIFGAFEPNRAGMGHDTADGRRSTSSVSAGDESQEVFCHYQRNAQTPCHHER